MTDFSPEQTAAMAAAVAEHLDACRNRPALPTDSVLQSLFEHHLFAANFSPSKASVTFARDVLDRWGAVAPQAISAPGCDKTSTSVNQ